VYNRPIEFRIPIYDDLYEIVLELRSRWLATYAELMEEKARAESVADAETQAEAQSKAETNTEAEVKTE
jgi:hypothetical protein